MFARVATFATLDPTELDQDAVVTSPPDHPVDTGLSDWLPYAGFENGEGALDRGVRKP